MTAKWQHQAACRGADWLIFYAYRRRREALDYCNHCTVRLECLEAAMADEEGEPIRAGVRGGLTAPSRKRLARARRRTAGAA